jgi:hypothetical protein
VIGRDDLITTSRDASRGTNGVVFRPVLGVDNQTPLPGFSAHNDDVARLHVEALHSCIPAGSYRATTNSTSRENQRDAVRSESLPNSGSSMTVPAPVRLDVSKNHREWLSGGISKALSNVGHYLELLESENM